MSEMDEHKQRLDKEYESLMQTFARDLDALKQRHVKELEKKVNTVHYSCLPF